MMQTRRVVTHEIHGVMVDAAAHEDEMVANPVRDAKAQNLLIEFCDLLDVLYARRDMSEFERADARATSGATDGVKSALGEYFDQRSFRIAKDKRLFDGRRQIRTQLA